MKLPFFQVDAFADAPFSGNSAAVIPLEAWLDDATLQAIAMENNLSETAFYIDDNSSAADFELRWFTPTAEVALCGHATLATGHIVLDAGGVDQVTFRTRKAGVLSVERSRDGYALSLPPTLVAPDSGPDLLNALGLSDGDVFHSISGAEATSIVLVADEAAVRLVAPDVRALAALDVMAIVTAPGTTTDVVSRVFAPAWGVDEDPVTGSAHAALTPFWAQRLGRDEFTAWQASARGGRIGCRLAGDRVVLTGRCVTVIEGVMRL